MFEVCEQSQASPISMGTKADQLHPHRKLTVSKNTALKCYLKLGMLLYVSELLSGMWRFERLGFVGTDDLGILNRLFLRGD